jgi:uncharacterized membrane protein YczE
MSSLIQFIRINKNSIAWYVSGFFILGLGVNIMKASTLGNGAWDTVTINLRAFLNRNVNLEWVTLGMVSFLVSMTLFMIVLVYRKEVRYFFMLIPIFLVALFIDFWNILIFQDRLLETLPWQLLFYIVGAFTLPLGLTMIIKSGFPAFVFDELMRMFVKVFKVSKITYVRLGIEFTGIAIGTIFGYLAFYGVDGTFGAVNIGSFVFTIAFSHIMTLWFFLLKVPHV